MFLHVEERKDFSDVVFKESRLQAIANPLQATGGVNSTLHLAHLSRCHARNFSNVHLAQVLVTSSGQDRWVVVLASLQSHSISSMFHRTLPDTQLSPRFSSCVVISFDVSIHCHSARSVMLGPTG